MEGRIRKSCFEKMLVNTRGEAFLKWLLGYASICNTLESGKFTGK